MQGFGASIVSTLAVILVILLGIFFTLGISKLLSKTILKGMPSSFVLELPPYRKPQFGKILIRSIFDRTLFVLGRAICVSVPAGAFIWLLQNVMVEDMTLLGMVSYFLEPLGNVMGLSGAILAAFLLGIPANEIVIPILLMYYSQSGMLVETSGIAELGEILQNNGWTVVTAACAILFSLNHFPCATTLWTVAKETKSVKWTIVSFLLPTIIGVTLCMIVNFGGKILLGM